MKASAGPCPAMPEAPRQRLPREAYLSDSWLACEHEHLFGRQWALAGVEADLPNPGDYVTLNVGNYPLMALRDGEGRLRAFHNLCRHRGTELLEGNGNLDAKNIVCPYHRWTYELDGTLKAVPLKKQCFADLDLGSTRLFEAAVASYKGLVFVHPDADAQFGSWRASLDEAVWPHEFEDMSAGIDVTYEMHCNWKVFFENAIDGYHLAHLHDQTLGGPRADLNVWDTRGSHLVWYSLETGERTCTPEAVKSARWDGKLIKNAERGDYGGVYMLFPNTIITASPTSLSVSTLVPSGAEVCLLRVRTWHGESVAFDWLLGEHGGIENYPGYDPNTGYMKLECLEQHALETGDFHWEDVWICEKMQRSLRSPKFEIGALAAGAGAESPLEFFQSQVLAHLEDT